VLAMVARATWSSTHVGHGLGADVVLLCCRVFASFHINFDLINENPLARF
jgi:hypothetical protein